MMFQMKFVLWIQVAVWCVCANLDAQHSSVVPVVNADGPTIVAFFPSASQTRSDDADSNEALSDFEFYADRVKEPLNRLGIEFTEQFGRSFRIRSGSQSRLFTPKADRCGYYFIAHDKKPRIEYGVMTDVDLLALAKQYFDSPHSAGKSIPEPFGSVLPEVKAKSRIVVLVPSELPQSLSKAKVATVEKASDGEYAISLYLKMDEGDAGFAALFAAESNPDYEPQELPNVREVKLSHELLGYFRPVSCGGSCAPANLWWKEDGVLYQIQLKLSPTLPENDQQKALTATANSAILAGSR
jgi:hypothetical protein